LVNNKKILLRDLKRFQSDFSNQHQSTFTLYGSGLTVAADVTLDNTTSVCLSKIDLLNAITNWTDARLMRAEKHRQHKWDFPGSIFFALTVVTTIGKCIMIAVSIMPMTHGTLHI
jgi:aspartyl/asparaginyl beta-hydroxylase (cupin superfamily)